VDQQRKARVLDPQVGEEHAVHPVLGSQAPIAGHLHCRVATDDL
jgi:hypothetical protein